MISRILLTHTASTRTNIPQAHLQNLQPAATSIGSAGILVALPRIVREVDPRAKASTAARGEITSRDCLKDSEAAGENGVNGWRYGSLVRCRKVQCGLGQYG